ncbi:MAG: phosphoglycerate dehydrogenase [Actinobacteria bacterium ATB1]|nr:phosphoglycerate dehydrogenase [Actinobacteria bacterium ATB1]
MKVLVTEKIADAGLQLLSDAGHEVSVELELSPDELLGHVADADALIVRSATQVTRDVISAAPVLKVVGRAGIGVDNIDLGAATAAGILVVNAPTSNVVSAAEHTMALLLAQARNLGQADATLREGKWERKRLEGVELYGKTLGILGLGRVGSLVAERALAFGMHVLAYDPFVSEERARVLGVELAGSVDEVLSRADMITVHLPRTPETEGLIDADAIARMKPGVRLVNVARGGIVDEAALAEALRTGRVGGAGIDVFDVEPCTDSPLFSEPAAVVSPHLGASTVEAQDRAGITIAEQVVAALAGEFVEYAVNVDIGRDVSEEVSRHLPVAEALGRFFAAYAGGVGDSVELEVAGALAEHDTRALVLAVLKGLFNRVTEEPVTFVNAPQVAESRGLEVREVTSSRSVDRVNLLTVRGKVHGRDYSVQGAYSGAHRQVRIVGVDEFQIELPPSQYMAVISNDDRPGVIGAVGTILGESGINIANMAVGRHEAEPYAMMGVNLDRYPPDDVQDTIRKSPGILDARFLEL